MYLEYDKSMEQGISNIPYLDNKFNIVNYNDISKFEYQTTADKSMELKSNGFFRNAPINFETLCAIHKYLLGDIYPWAGTIREVNLYKEDSEFCRADYLENGLNQYFKELLKDNNLKGYNKEDFCELLAYYTNELNFLHPFREGNGRSKRLFLSELSLQAGWEIDFSKIDSKQLLMCEILAFGNTEGAIQPDLLELKKLYLSSVNPTLEKKIELYQTKEETDIERLNRFMWVHDRGECRQWRRSNLSFENAGTCIEGMLKEDNGKEYLFSVLSRISKNTSDEDIKSEAKGFKSIISNTTSSGYIM